MHDLHRGKWEIMAVNYYFQKSMWIFFLVINGMKIFETNGRSQFQNISNSLINILLKVSAYCKSAQILQKKQIRFNNNTYKFSKFSNKCSNNFKTIFDLLLSNFAFITNITKSDAITPSSVWFFLDSSIKNATLESFWAVFASKHPAKVNYNYF